MVEKVDKKQAVDELKNTDPQEDEDAYQCTMIYEKKSEEPIDKYLEENKNEPAGDQKPEIEQEEAEIGNPQNQLKFKKDP